MQIYSQKNVSVDPDRQIKSNEWVRCDSKCAHAITPPAGKSCGGEGQPGPIATTARSCMSATIRLTRLACARAHSVKDRSGLRAEAESGYGDRQALDAR